MKVDTQFGELQSLERNLESDQIDFSDLNRRPHWMDFAMVCFFHSLQMAGITIVFTTVEAYQEELGLESMLWSGLLIGIVPLIAGISGFFWQFINDKFGYAHTQASMAVVATLGSCIYAFAGAVKSPGTLVLGRVLMGVSGASNIPFHYIAVTTGRNKKGQYVGLVAACGTAGLGIGPFLSGVIDAVVEGAGLGENSPIIFNILTAPAWVIGFLYAVCALLFWTVFNSPPVSEIQRYKATLVFEKDDSPNGPIFSWLNAALAVILLAVVVLGSGNGSMETRTAFIAISNHTKAHEIGTGFAWSWSLVIAGIYISVVSLAFSFFNLAHPRVSAKFPGLGDRHWVLMYSVVGTISSALLYNYPISKDASIVVWTLGMLTFNGSIGLCKTVVFSLALKLCPSKWIGRYTSTLGLMNSIGRAIGPVFATYIGDGYLQAVYFALILTTMMAATTISFLVVFPHLKLSSKKA